MKTRTMDTPLAERLNNLDAQNKALGAVRDAYLLKEAARKNYESRLVKDADGKSYAEKLMNAQATDEWLQFHVELAALEGALEFEKLKFEILDKAFLAEYASFKIDERTIKRGGAA